MKSIIRTPAYPPRIDGKTVPIDERNVQEKPDCLGSKYFDLSRSEAGEPVGLCIQCILWRECREKRITR